MFLLNKLINCGAKDVSFAEFVKTFYEKAAERNIDMKPSLDFMLKISDKVDELNSRFKDFESNQELKPKFKMGAKKLRKVPGKIWRKYATEEDQKKVSGYIDEIAKNWFQKTEIPKTKFLCSEIAYKLPNASDKKFDSMYQAWLTKSLKDTDLASLQSLIKETWTKEFNGMLREFRAAVAQLDTYTRNLHALIATVNSLIDTLEKPTDSARETLENLQSNMREIREIQNKLLQSVLGVNEILRSYNAKRLEWTTHIIQCGTRVENPRRNRPPHLYLSNSVTNER